MLIKFRIRPTDIKFYNCLSICLFLQTACLSVSSLFSIFFSSNPKVKLDPKMFPSQFSLYSCNPSPPVFHLFYQLINIQRFQLFNQINYRFFIYLISRKRRRIEWLETRRSALILNWPIENFKYYIKIEKYIQFIYLITKI